MPRLSKSVWAEIIGRYQNGELATSLAREFGCSGVAVSAMLKRKGVSAHDTSYVYRTAAGHILNEMAFDVLTPDAAYWIGFLMADGSVTDGNTIALVLSEKDTSHLEKFKQFLGASNKIVTGIINRYSTNCKESRGARFAVRSKNLCKVLNKYGVTQNKSATARASEQIAGNRDFWRGVVDGDGYIALQYRRSYFNAHPRINAWSKPRVDARLELVGSEPLLNQFKTFVESIIPSADITVRPHKNIFRVGLGGKTAEILIATLYKDASEGLDRKVNAARNILSFATAGEAGLARGLGKNLSDHVSGTKVEARTEAEKFDEAVRLERAA